VSTFLVAVDPGIRGCGVACFTDGVLDRAAYVKSPARSGNGLWECVAVARAVEDWYEGVADVVAVEWPQVYASRIMKGQQGGDKDPNDLLALCGIDAAVATLLLEVGWEHGNPMSPSKFVTYRPREWKGQMTKEACHTRLRSRLSPDETAVVDAASREAKSLAHNMLDAVGIGLHHLGRLAPRRVITP
jgi:hypothetical protein